MNLFKTGPAADALEDLLEAEHKAILKSDYEMLERLLPVKEKLLMQTAKEAAIGDSLTRLRLLSDRNNALLAAAAKGVNAAVNRLRKLREGPDPLQTYGPAGQRQSLSPTSLTMERKA
ncbi:MAG: hypothetical protein ACRBBK_05165 [Paracoccaceae bacterium]